jgi:hypothetical protein
VRLGFLAQVHGVGAAFGLAHHAELGAPLENALDAVAH